LELADISINVDKLENGGWVDKIPGMGDARLKVRGIGNADYIALQEKLLTAVPQELRTENRPVDSELHRIVTECLIETVLLDWESLFVNGQPVAYAKPLARKLIEHPALKRFRDAVAWAGAQMANQKADALAFDVGN
jgi:hypothetical protein